MKSVLCMLAVLAAGAAALTTSEHEVQPIVAVEEPELETLEGQHQQQQMENQPQPIVGGEEFAELPETLPVYATPNMDQLQLGKTAKLIASKTPPQPQPIVKPVMKPKTAAVLGEETRWSNVEAVRMAKPHSMKTIELKPIFQTYTVHETKFTQENIKKPITEPIIQPYLQRFIQQQQPILQPVVQKIYQPIVHRELRPEMSARIEKGQALKTIVNPLQTENIVNKPVLGHELKPLKISKKHSAGARAF